MSMRTTLDSMLGNKGGLVALTVVLGLAATALAAPKKVNVAQKASPQAQGATMVKPGIVVAPPKKVVPGIQLNKIPIKNPKLYGFADLHTHPMSHLGFGRKAMHGAPDVGMLLAPGTTLGCNQGERRSTTMADALGGNCNATHGGWGVDNTCGDHIRAAVINNALDSSFWHIVGLERNLHNDHVHDGYPALDFWPHHSSILHQQMWWEWLKRAHQGGLRVIVALTVNSETLGDVLNGDAPYDDKTVADVQIAETIRFVNQHNRRVNSAVKPEHDFMEIAYSAADAERIVRENRLAVILGMEVDKIGNFGKPGVKTDEAAVRAEIRRLHAKGVRYAFPIHLIDNAFGGTAVYKVLFNYANYNQNGRYFSVAQSPDGLVTSRADFVSSDPGVDTIASAGFYAMLQAVGAMPAPCFNDLLKCQPFPPGAVRCCGSYEKITRILRPTAQFDAYKRIPPGHANSQGLTPLGEAAIDEMMKLGMIIDVDHMSERSMRETVEIAKGVDGGYPLVMGHNGVRRRATDPDEKVSERSAPADIVRQLARLGGMMGQGTAHTNPANFVADYKDTLSEFRREVGDAPAVGLVGLGTDVNGFEPLPHRGASREGGPDKTTTVPGDAWGHPPAQLTCDSPKKIEVRSARIGCLDIQRSGNLSSIVASACNGKTSCSYKAPTPAEYQRQGVQAATRTFCSQAMEIVYRCTTAPGSPADSRTFYADFYRQSGITSKQKKPNGKEWDYILEGGVSHYGLMPEFLHEVRTEDAAVYNSIMGSADAFVRMWQKAESVRSSVGKK